MKTMYAINTPKNIKTVSENEDQRNLSYLNCGIQQEQINRNRGKKFLVPVGGYNRLWHRVIVLLASTTTRLYIPQNLVSDVVAPERNIPDPDPNFRKNGSGPALEIERKNICLSSSGYDFKMTARTLWPGSETPHILHCCYAYD
jgi:hypothetical protein